MKITEAEYNIIKKAEEITSTECEITWTDAENFEGYIDPEELLSMIENLTIEYEEKAEELKDKEEYCEEYHVERYRDEYDMYGISRDDF